ncbi:MAG: RluA family pseudouridine synthase [Candidatus Obscuribacterales bacterium]
MSTNDADEMDEAIVLETGGDGEAAGCRLDQYLSKKVPDLSRARIKKLIDKSQIDVDGKPARASQKLKGNETITVAVPPPESVDILPEDIGLDIVFEDDDLIVINKQVGLVTHPGAGTSSGTLVNALLHHCGETLSGISGELRPGIVHRLDKDTSGLLVVAKNDRAHRNLASQIAEKSARRSYTAIVDGVLKEDQGIIDEPIGRHPGNRKKMAIREDGRQARTHYRVLTRMRDFTLVRADLETGRTHQIRVHFAHLGHPVAGDILYNKRASGGQKGRDRLGLKGQALHATSLSFRHPVSGQLLEFKAPLPDDFAEALSSLKR